MMSASPRTAQLAIGWFMNRRYIRSLTLNCLTATPFSRAASTTPGVAWAAATWRGSSIGDPRVDDGVGDIGEQVEEGDENRGNEEDAHQEGIVVRLQGLEE